MSNRPDDQSIIFNERNVLRAMCARVPGLTAKAATMLADYTWREPIHKVVFDCLVRIASADPEILRELLPECATRKGFPDVNWKDFLTPEPASRKPFEEWLQELINLKNQK